MKEIDLETWNRKDIYKVFSEFENPFFAVTIPVDVTAVKQFSKSSKISFYYTMIWAVTKAVNQVPQLNIRIRNGHLYQLDQVDANFTILKKGNDVFQFVTAPWVEDIHAFASSIDKQLEVQGDDCFSDAIDIDEAVYLTCTPWFDFTAATNPHTKNTEDAIPRIAWGKYYEENDRLMVHMSIEVNHRTVDGYHVGLLKEAIDSAIASLDE